MTHQDKEFYEALLEMFTNCSGWKHFIEEVEKWRDSAEKSWATIEKAEDFYVTKGNLQTLTYITNFESVVRNHLSQQEQDDADL